jgi:hypothetical protein
MKVQNNSSILEYCKATPVSPQFVETLKGKANEVLENAVETFFKPDREPEEGARAYNDLCDLQSGLRSLMKDAVLSRRQNLKEARRDAKKLDSSPHRVAVHAPKDTNTGLSKIVKDLHQMLPVYACVALPPGPLSASLKNTAKEFFDYAHQAQAKSESSHSSEASAIGASAAASFATTLFGGSQSSGESIFRSRASSQGQSYATGSESASASGGTSTADERVMPMLHDLRYRVSEMAFSPSNELATLKGAFYEAHLHSKGTCDIDRLFVPEDAFSFYEQPEPFFWDTNDTEKNSLRQLAHYDLSGTTTNRMPPPEAES